MTLLRTIAAGLLLLSIVVAPTPLVLAQQTQDSFSGLDTEKPISPDPIKNDGEGNITEAVESLMFQVIKLMGIAAVFVLVIVGIGLVIGIGSEESRSRAIKVILYVAAGILVIGLASVFVRFIVDALFG